MLELGCGTGGTAAALAGEVASYFPTDISTRIIAMAEERHGAARASGLTFAVGTAKDAAMPAGGFDAVLALN